MTNQTFTTEGPDPFTNLQRSRGWTLAHSTTSSVTGPCNVAWDVPVRVSAQLEAVACCRRL